ncbi:NADH-FMN oxidoreductase RutF, flavin reductase (DIM6/NTAB) family [Pelagirhabdus alkalitolerans]|uniref:NADH-FMN oxidoreductase RutF, flavin reductase (DIM6/NTAB) family n=1 Tax=Pelagirhabdus alkalitolerans TaxID=1612202 RepID=A0A1G6H7E4_9BACI|nr:flavin reductase family protein [Pelagirhabdus alkalitolerans]SDB89865.1 NADH-FMN oxidoreductase RutF, flavin reductase (DIM6/NTAB) family [Pelagirhabdus alkalitolerans]
MVSDKQFKQAMSQFATGITVVSAEENKEVKGITVNAFMSLSLDPMLIAISLQNKANMIQTLENTDQFGISILKDDQQEESMIFANQKKPEQPVSFDYVNQTPVIPNALVQIVCEKESVVEAGDHTIVIAKVNEINNDTGKPLIYFGGHYQALNEKL